MRKTRQGALAAMFLSAALAVFPFAAYGEESGLKLHYDFSRESLTPFGMVWDVSGAEQCGMLITHWSEASNEVRLPGADVVVMRQSPNGANTLSQEIVGLESGSLYSLRFTTADYGDMVEARKAGRQPKETPARPAVLSARLDGVDVLPEKSFSPGTPQGPKRDEESRLYWEVVETGINFHRIVFRAQSNSALLTFADKPADGGETRENLLMWVSVRPYLED